MASIMQKDPRRQKSERTGSGNNYSIGYLIFKVKTNSCSCRQTDRQMVMQTDRQTNGHADRQMVMQTDRQTLIVIQTDR